MEISNRFWNSFHASPQALAYVFALSVMADEKVVGFIVEAIRTSKCNAESLMGINFVQTHQIQRFLDFANRTSEAILECNEKQEWPQRCSGCATYSMFGQPGYYCDFKKICDSTDWKSVLKFYSKEAPFHPFEMI